MAASSQQPGLVSEGREIRDPIPLSRRTFDDADAHVLVTRFKQHLPVTVALKPSLCYKDRMPITGCHILAQETVLDPFLVDPVARPSPVLT